MYMLE